eukprot:CAMPEP_0172527680 /NCGR_PEP_ID=MMETSP1067-20121228/2314_1 /TAXON_ID=265564 ORGANISM="Thalassiosira punctigera, Strain Tpunct2005C2" /NCGR_SAMPLE_ID=MMETSP1067 /ASSEMBLY_ACC=CAM_ASM_000444 /LENGTH=169 /DNA_ID=CAMNT_0013311473 /DNA_START=28 /DNA_END=537 /DNA_ORIENTATION=+
MKVVTIIPVLFASALCTSVSDAAEMEARPYRYVEDEAAVEGEVEDPYSYVAILKAMEEDRVVMNKQKREVTYQTINVKQCVPKIEALATCFEFVQEPYGEECWRDCVDTLPQNDPDSCPQFCMEMEQCRSSTCQSGSACMIQYYEMMNCALHSCNCDIPTTNLRTRRRT